MKRIFTLIASVALVVAGVARAQTVANQVIVSQYSNWSVQGTVALASGTNTAIPFSPCAVSGANKNFQAFTASVPVKIVDPNNPSIDEVVTPVGGCLGSWQLHGDLYYGQCSSDSVFHRIGLGWIAGSRQC